MHLIYLFSYNLAFVSKYLQGKFLDGLYWEYEFEAGDQHRYICPGGEDRTGPCPLDPNDRNILYENRLLGLPRYTYCEMGLVFAWLKWLLKW